MTSSGKHEKAHWNRPNPNAALMHALGFVNRWFLLRGAPVLRSIPFVRTLPLGRGYFGVRRLDIPRADLERLERAVNRDTAAFLGPNHPEFGTDWMIDKEISTLVSPLMASWADRGIVAAAPGFWGRNNLVANDGGEDAKNYSIECALRGEGVLLHPEGTVRWTGDLVHALFPGIAQMALAAAARTSKPVYIVPLVWKYVFDGDVSPRAHREMEMLEHELGLDAHGALDIPHRFLKLQENVLASRMMRFGYSSADPSASFFARQAAFQAWIVAELEARHDGERTGDLDRRIARVARTIRGKRTETPKTDRDTRRALRHDMELAEEAKRLGEFSESVYGGPTLTQEHVFESLKRMRDRLLKRNWRDAVGNMLPSPFGLRVAYVGVPEPLRVQPGDDQDALLTEARSRMQASLDAINQRVEPQVARYRINNPFCTAPRT